MEGTSKWASSTEGLKPTELSLSLFKVLDMMRIKRLKINSHNSVKNNKRNSTRRKIQDEKYASEQEGSSG